MSIGVLMVIQCDGCLKRFPEPFHSGDAAVRSRAKEMGWKHVRKPYEEGSAFLDICPDCAKEQTNG